MMTRNELRKLKCRGCWWQEGSRCYNHRIAVIIRNDEEYLQEGEEITEELLVKCEKKDRVSKRDVLVQYFEGGSRRRV